jgi:hypothetical protein
VKRRYCPYKKNKAEIIRSLSGPSRKSFNSGGLYRFDTLKGLSDVVFRWEVARIITSSEGVVGFEDWNGESMHVRIFYEEILISGRGGLKGLIGGA